MARNRMTSISTDAIKEPNCGTLAGGSATLSLDDEAASRLAVVFKALGHPVRIQIIDLLSRYGGQVCVCEIERQFELSQPTISHHLKVLRDAGLLSAEKRGLWVYYDLRSQVLISLRKALKQFDPDRTVIP
jgi:ArsR family transcriptional regulator